MHNTKAHGWAEAEAASPAATAPLPPPPPSYASPGQIELSQKFIQST